MAVRAPPVAAVQVEVMPLISEFLVTAGDVGSSATDLAKEFPMVSKSV